MIHLTVCVMSDEFWFGALSGGIRYPEILGILDIS